MARRKPRKGAGPPPAVSPRRAAQESSAAKAPATRRQPGEPVPVSPKGVVVRAAVVAAFFLPYLIFVAGEEPAVALAITALAFCLMLPLGLLLDRIRYNRQMRRYTEKRAGSARR